MPTPITPDTTQYVTLAELKAHLNITTTSDDAELELHRSASEEHVQGVIGPVLQREVVETSTTRYGATLLRVAPVVSVTSVEYASTALAGWSSSLSTGLITGLPTGDVTVTYTVGRTSCPDAVKLATLIIAGHLWETQRGASSPSSALPADAFDQTTTLGLGFLVPNRAMELLTPYLLAPGLA